MVLSMTGYGSSTATSANYKVTVELKSLNSKYIEINMKLPRVYMQHEMPLRNMLTKTLKRGKVNAVMNVEVLNPDKAHLRINGPLVKAYADTLENWRKELKINEQAGLEYILSLPDAISQDDNSDDEEEWELINQAFHEAAEKLLESRQKEGTALYEDMKGCSARIAEQLLVVNDLVPKRRENIRSRINQSLQEVRDRAQVDGNRFEQELIYYIEKLDINEETVRLKKHLEYFDQSLAVKSSNGKKLGFISQEMGREINTIGSKANDQQIQVAVVKMKEELEKIKEQVQNIV